MDNPLVSVLVTVYKQGRYVRETLESVLSQSYRNWEMIVTDDHSPDNSLEEIRRVSDPRMQIVARPQNSGLANIPRNEMIRAAKGKYLAFLDGDDIWLPEKLGKQVAFMERNPEFAFSHVACMVVDETGEDLYLRNGGNYPPNGDCFRLLLEKTFICTSAVMLKRSLVDKVGLFSEDRELRNNGDDTEFFLRCAKVYPIGMPSDEILVKYRWDNQSLTHHPQRWKPGLDLLSRRYLWEGRIAEKDLRDVLWRTWEGKGYEMRREGRWGPAMWYAGKMIGLRWWRAGGWKMFLAAISGRK